MLPLSFASFFGFGAVLILVGANQSELARHYALGLRGSGQLVSALALGVGLGVVSMGPLFDRLSRRPLFVGTLLITGVALSTVDADGGFRRLLAHVFAAGIGVGGINTLINASVAERFAERSARPMSLVHSAATAGAMLGPVVIGLLWADDWSASFRFTGGGHLVLALWAFFVRLPSPRRHGVSASERDLPCSPAATRLLSGRMIPFAGIAFAYVGIETSLVIFAIPYALESAQLAAKSTQLAAESGRLAISAFWLGLLLGRLAILGRRTAPHSRTLVTAGGLGGILLAVGVGVGTLPVETLFGLVGFAFGSIYPITMALTGHHFERSRGSAVGLVAGAGALGGFTIPWLTGALGDGAGISAALFSLAGWALLVAAFAAAAPSHPPHGPETRRGMLRPRQAQESE